MNVAHILPPRAIQHVQDLLGDYHLILPSLLRDETYRNGYKGLARIDYLMLDNGVAEGSMSDFIHLLAAARAMGVQEVVLPDVMRDMDKTLRAAASVFYHAFENRRQYRFMLVCQGTTVSECFQTAERAMNMFPGIIDVFGIPRHILSVHPDARLRIAQKLRDKFRHIPIHLLGTHPEHTFEIKDCRNSYADLDIRGFDTSLAWNATLQGVRLRGHESLSYNLIVERQPIDEFRQASFDHADSRYIKLLRENMEEINSWVK